MSAKILDRRHLFVTPCCTASPAQQLFLSVQTLPIASAIILFHALPLPCCSASFTLCKVSPARCSQTFAVCTVSPALFPATSILAAILSCARIRKRTCITASGERIYFSSTFSCNKKEEKNHQTSQQGARAPCQSSKQYGLAQKSPSTFIA